MNQPFDFTPPAHAIVTWGGVVQIMPEVINNSHNPQAVNDARGQLQLAGRYADWAGQVVKWMQEKRDQFPDELGADVDAAIREVAAIRASQS